MPGAIFPIVFHPVPPPKSIALDSGETSLFLRLTIVDHFGVELSVFNSTLTEPKPFIDVSIITRFNQHSSVMQFK